MGSTLATSTPDVAAPRQVRDEQAYLRFEQLRWAGWPARCPHCSAPGRCYLLRPADGVRRTRTGAGTGRRLWKCGACRRQFSVLTGTVLQGTRVPLPAWIAAVELLAGAGTTVSTADICAATGLGPESARHVLARWRAAGVGVGGAAGGARSTDGSASRALAALLAIDTAEAAAVRSRTPARRRHRAQYGPQLDLGDGSGDRLPEDVPAGLS